MGINIQAATEKAKPMFENWRNDWNKFARDVLQIQLDPQQQEILYSVQVNPKTTVKSGTSRGKDYTAAAAAVCFLYLTPKWSSEINQYTKLPYMIENTKVAMTAPTDRQVGNIMAPEVSRIWRNAKFRLPGNLTGYDIRFRHLGYDEWFLTGFKADDQATESWSGFHAVNTLFLVTEASGMSELVFNAIEGNLQGNSRILIVFNPNIPTGYAAASQRSPRWARFTLDSLTAPNVLQRKMIFPGQVDWEWINGKVQDWCSPITQKEVDEDEGDFEWEGVYYRPNDLFRVKVRGMFPKVAEDVLIPQSWLDKAHRKWEEMQSGEIVEPRGFKGTPREVAMYVSPLRLGVDIAGQGRDANVFIHRYGNYVDRIEKFTGKGETIHMEMAGKIKTMLEHNTNDIQGRYAQGFIDTLGEGAGTFSRLWEMAQEAKAKVKQERLHSVKFSYSPTIPGSDVQLTDITEEREFYNMKAYLYWSIRDWLNPQNKFNAALPPDDELDQELTETKWALKSNGRIYIEEKDKIKERIKRSPDKADALANTFYPVKDYKPAIQAPVNYGQYFK